MQRYSPTTFQVVRVVNDVVTHRFGTIWSCPIMATQQADVMQRERDQDDLDDGAEYVAMSALLEEPKRAALPPIPLTRTGAGMGEAA